VATDFNQELSLRITRKPSYNFLFNHLGIPTFQKLDTILQSYSLPNTHIQSRSQSYVTTDGQLASLCWNKAPSWGLRPDFYYCQTIVGLLMWALSLTWGRVFRLQLLLALASAVILWSESCGTRDHILLSQIRDSPTWRARSPQEQGGPVTLPGSGFHFLRLLRLAGL
jgi:hypothetical protein